MFHVMILLAAISAPTTMQFKETGTVVFDASHNQTTFRTVAQPRTFKDMNAFAAFAQKTLNAVPIRDKSGAIVGVHGRFVQIGTPYIARKDGTIHAVRDSVAAYLGGESGMMVIGKRTLHLSAAQRTGNVDRLAYDGPLNRLAQSGVPSDVSRCSNGYCVHDSSFITNLFFYKSLGGETDETAGGFQTSSHFCWNGFLPWVCTTSSGHNVMSINNTFFAFISPIDHDSAWHADTQSLTVKEWAIGTVLGIVGDMTGVCSTHDPGQPFGATTLKAEQGMPACS